MGLADRDYMRQRHARRQGLRWNDRCGRVELDEADLVNRQYARRRRPRSGGALFARPISRRSVRWLVLVTSFLVIGSSLVADYLRASRHAFPPSGSVIATQDLAGRRITGRLAITSASDPAIVRLLTPGSARRVLSIYMRPHSRRIVPVPAGLWSVQVASGPVWLGPQKLFGPCTHVMTGRGLVRVRDRQTQALDLPFPDRNVSISGFASRAGWCALGARFIRL